MADLLAQYEEYLAAEKHSSVSPSALTENGLFTPPDKNASKYCFSSPPALCNDRSANTYPRITPNTINADNTSIGTGTRCGNAPRRSLLFLRSSKYVTPREGKRHSAHGAKR